MYQLHIANKNYSSWSLRPWVLMRALGIPFAEVLHPFSDEGNRDAFRRFSPTAKVPCLIDGEQVVWDSLAIAEYLAERHPQVWPLDGPARSWARCASAEMHSGFEALRSDCSMSCGQRVSLHRQGPALERDLARVDELWCEGLARFGGPFLAAGHFTAADAFYAPVVFRVETYALALSPAARAYQMRLLKLPAMVEWYTAALAEPWRETSHERGITAAGRVTADYRVPA